ncbi:MAG: hypothetical protein FI710_09805, partial [SAR202 cluster bacterium]|nr:hypothetical protein [SAR202 cluster bacterium]
GYPARLKEIADPPAVLFYKRTLSASDDRSVAIFGTGNPTTYGREAATVLSRGLAQAGLTVISGLALDIDTAWPTGGFGERRPHHRCFGGRSGPGVPDRPCGLVPTDRGTCRRCERAGVGY